MLSSKKKRERKLIRGWFSKRFNIFQAVQNHTTLTKEEDCAPQFKMKSWLHNIEYLSSV
jgi:hypothetical protein